MKEKIEKPTRRLPERAPRRLLPLSLLAPSWGGV